ncbi:UNVERIFIED_ORG: hypothetical protein ABIC62_002743 [Burkholderia sp. 1595]|uniref:Uncharacterized protein n=1 Tax=Paraburkholderia terricola TaxID=169427 RepID=A0ABU1LUA0_9BURK|nr:hypothetical protein [Paraburkholderia terricola]MDR6481250.1 hypothetical protein [Paraburkholderia terricola]
MRQVNPTLASTTHDDIETLVQMRIDAMRESLERIGRFEPRRARDRFVSSFDSALCASSLWLTAYPLASCK